MNDLLARRRLPVGAEVLDERSIHFRLWGPNCRRVNLVVPEQAGRNEALTIDLQAEGSGFFSLLTEMEAGARYAFRLDGAPTPLPDPASRFQPNGPEGFSQIVDPRRFQWSDENWDGLQARGQVIYEMHIGTFTPAGTWKAAAAELRELARAGMTVLEIMPVADFVGDFGWGYDGVCMFAPTRLYGTPDDFRQFVDHAHSSGLGVILDVVYNHFGNVGNTVPRFAVDYESQRYQNDWGDSINFDGRDSGPVREFFRANVRYWIEEFHLDGLRFDAIPAIRDHSGKHILSELTMAAREAAGRRKVLLIAEDRATLEHLMPILNDIIEHHLRGTRFGIRVDPEDGLLIQGQQGYQLTWMDAKVGDWVVTPRRGKAVEINALWYNALRLMEKWHNETGDAAGAARMSQRAEQARESFNRRFWYGDGNYLFDVIDGEHGNDAALRPNQIFALSLEHPVLDRARWESVLNTVSSRLITPFGLRNLAPGDPDYKARYDGNLLARDAAYHQGTVWAWLIGPFIDAWLRVHPGDTVRARDFLSGFGPHLTEACVGSISEVFDAEAPYYARGCVAQAWSVAEVLRSWFNTVNRPSSKRH